MSSIRPEILELESRIDTLLSKQRQGISGRKKFAERHLPHRASDKMAAFPLPHFDSEDERKGKELREKRRLHRENRFLKERCLLLQQKVTGQSDDLEKMEEEKERFMEWAKHSSFRPSS